MRDFNPWLAAALVFAIAVVAYMALSTKAPQAPESAHPQEHSEPVEARDPWQFEPLAFDDARILQARAERAVAAASLNERAPEYRALLERYRAFALASAAATMVHAPERFERIHQEWVAAIIDFNARFGAAGYALAGEKLLARMKEVMQLRLPPLPEKLSAPVATRLSAAAMAASWRHSLDVLAYLGDFAALAQSEGWLDEQGALRAADDATVQLLFGYLWAQLGAEVFSLERLMSPTEIMAVRRWQLERSSLPVEQKRQLIARLHDRLGDYDLTRTEAILLRQAGEREAAASLLQQGLEKAQKAAASERAALYQSMLSTL
ncbi:MAG: hypothetical protein RBU37_19570 [Myxococcota bacterium]|jgi:hypothetical protein|nr:hypothetical protein [Myxococcota bacterium]